MWDKLPWVAVFEMRGGDTLLSMGNSAVYQGVRILSHFLFLNIAEEVV